MNRAGMFAELKEVLNESTTLPAWTEATLLGYLAEGQDKFCEETGFFTDLSNFTITLEAGVAVYAIPDRVIQIIDIWDGTRKLGKIATGSRFPEGDTPTTGDPSHWQTDQETGIIKLYPAPTADQAAKVLVLQVWRYSLYDLAGVLPIPEGEDEAPPAVPEIPARFQRACIEWAAYKAFMHHDMEAQDPVKASEHKVAFMSYVADGRLALQRRQNQEVRVGFSAAYRT